MTKHDEYDFTQFKGSFDSPMSPESDFTARMKQMLEREPEVVSTQQRNTVLASPSRSNKEVPVPGRRTHPLTIAASVLVVLAVVVSSIWVLSDASLEGEYGSAPSGIATLPADADVTPGADVQLTAELIPGTKNVDVVNAIYDDTLLYESWPSRDTETGLVREMAVPTTPVPLEVKSTLSALDMNTGEVLWELPNMSLETLVRSGDTVVGQQWDSLSDGTIRKIRLVAVDLESGEILWEHTVRDTSGPLWSLPSLMIVDGHVVFSDIDGKITSIDLDTGALSWERSYDPGEGFEMEFPVNEDSKTITKYNVASTSWSDYIVVVNGDGLLQVLDPSSGETVASHLLLDSSTEKQAINQLQIETLSDGVLVVRDTADLDGQRSNTLAVDPLSGEIFWEKEFDGRIYAQVSDDGSIAMTSSEYQQYNRFMQLFGLYGYTSSQFVWLGSAQGDEILQTEPGKTEFGLFAITDGEYGCTRTSPDQIICFDRNGTRHILDGNSYGHPELSDGVLYISMDDGVYRVELP